jgi:site-specific recombinase XerD
MLLKDFFAYAVKKYKLKENPTLETSRPEVHTPKMRVLTQEEMIIFLEEVIHETQRVAILVDLFTGLRVGELLALEVSDLDVKTQSMEIMRNIARVRTESADLDNPHIKVLNYRPDKKTHLIVQETPKTKTSNRMMPLSDGVFTLIAKHLYYLEQSDWPNPHNLLFPSTKGTYIDPKSYELRLEAVSKRCEIRKVNPHALRHTFATRLIEEKVPITTVQELLGHASVSTTQRYVTTMIEEKRDAVESMSLYLNGHGAADLRRLNGSKRRMKFEDVRLPSWLQNGTRAAEISQKEVESFQGSL